MGIKTITEISKLKFNMSKVDEWIASLLEK